MKSKRNKKEQEDQVLYDTFNIGEHNKGCFNVGTYNDGHGNTGNFNEGDKNTGFHNKGNKNTGDDNCGDNNTGKCNNGNINSGNSNNGSYNSGAGNEGYYNSGNNNIGNLNTGSLNFGNCNSGLCNNGDFNTGSFNLGYYNYGFLNTGTPKLRIFNKETDLTDEEIMFKLPYFFFKVKVCRWVDEEDMTDEEKEDNPRYGILDGFLKQVPYKEAWMNAFTKAKESDDWEKEKNRLLELPNFDFDIFEEITGITKQMILSSDK